MNDLRYPSAEEECQKHKLKRLVQAPNSYFMDVKCPGCLTMLVIIRFVNFVVPLSLAMLKLPLYVKSRGIGRN